MTYDTISTKWRTIHIMLKNNLKILMAERNLKATRVSLETGISRSTISSLVNNNSKMIQNETLNTLCTYLKVTPNDFFSFTDWDLIPTVEVTKIDIDKTSSEYQTNGELNWDININAISGDLFINTKKNLNKMDILELSFKIIPLTVDEDIYGEFHTIPVHIDYSEKTRDSFSTLWLSEKLSPFYEVFIYSLEDEFNNKLKDALNGDLIFQSSKLKINNFEFEFDANELPISNF